VVAIATTRYCDGVGVFLWFFVINCNEKNSKDCIGVVSCRSSAFIFVSFRVDLVLLVMFDTPKRVTSLCPRALSEIFSLFLGGDLSDKHKRYEKRYSTYQIKANY